MGKQVEAPGSEPTSAGRRDLAAQAELLSGADFWSTAEVVVAGETVVESMVLNDGPHGLRRQPDDADALGVGDSVPATCFPTAVTLGSTWDPVLVARVGAALGREAAALGTSMLLGPGMNIKRSPLGGRNFEYFSEDPLATGVLASAMVEGIQSQGVAACPKHFAVNSQETDRHRISADVALRPLHEIYLSAFERVVRTSAPWAIMASYNRVNGEFVAESELLLTEVLRGKWSFDGVVVSDWGAVHDRVASLRAGLDLEMPGVSSGSVCAVLAAVEAGELDPEIVARAAANVARLADRTRPARARGRAQVDVGTPEHHELAVEAAVAGSVLLKNVDAEGEAVLPLADSSGAIALIGALAEEPRFQGAGSSQVNPSHLVTPLEALRAELGARVTHVPGYSLSDDASSPDRLAAVEAARAASTAMVVLGTPPQSESEGFDRASITLPPGQVELLRAVRSVCARVVVVVQSGGVVDLTGIEPLCDALMAVWLGGEGGGTAIARMTVGKDEPSGRLSETIPRRLEDVGSFVDFPGEFGHVAYGEGVHVGYRYVDKRGIDVHFPFGFGLGYTTFDLGSATAALRLDGGIDLELDVTNVGGRRGSTVVQVYISVPDSGFDRSPRALGGFAKVSLEAGASERVTIAIDRQALSIWHPSLERWFVEPARYEFVVGLHSRDERSRVALMVAGDADLPPIDEWSTLGETLAHPDGREALNSAWSDGRIKAIDESLRKTIEHFPLRVLASFEDLLLNRPQLDELLEAINGGGRRSDEVLGT